MISSNVVIMTVDELNKLKDDVFQKGVKRGRFEETLDKNEFLNLLKSAEDVLRMVESFKKQLSYDDLVTRGYLAATVAIARAHFEKYVTTAKEEGK